MVWQARWCRHSSRRTRISTERPLGGERRGRHYCVLGQAPRRPPQASVFISGESGRKGPCTPKMGKGSRRTLWLVGLSGTKVHLPTSPERSEFSKVARPCSADQSHPVFLHSAFSMTLRELRPSPVFVSLPWDIPSTPSWTPHALPAPTRPQSPAMSWTSAPPPSHLMALGTDGQGKGSFSQLGPRHLLAR